MNPVLLVSPPLRFASFDALETAIWSRRSADLAGRRHRREQAWQEVPEDHRRWRAT